MKLNVFESLAIAGAMITVFTPVLGATITISCGALGVEQETCSEATEAWTRQSGHNVKVISTPNSSTARLSLYQQILSAKSNDIDVMQIDVVWPGILDKHFVDLSRYTKGAEKAHFPSLIENNTVKGRLVAMPWFTDAGLLFYRKDLLEKHGEKVPQTWEQLSSTAARIQKAERSAGNNKIWGFVWQGRAYEGLTCDALEWIYSYNGGTIIAADGKVTINNPQAVKALNTAKEWVGSISPVGVLNYSEEEARTVFQSGHAVFMRNWPYAWSLSQTPESPVQGKIGVAALPKGGSDGQHAGTLGGWQLAVSRYSDNPDVAADLVMFLTSYEEQKRRAIKGAFNPTIKRLYYDEEVLSAVPFFGNLHDIFVNAVARPSKATGASYNQVSQAFWKAVHSVLSRKVSSKRAVTHLENQLEQLVQ